MHVNRKTLYLGVFLVISASVVLAGQAGWLDLDLVARALGLWPLAIIAIGAALLLRGTRASLASGVVAATVPALLLGGAVSAAPQIDFNCGATQPTAFSTQDGAFVGRANVNLDLSCGDLVVHMGPGSSWQARTADSLVSSRAIESTGQRLLVSSGDRRYRLGESWDAESWDITLPTEVTIDLLTRVNAGEGHLGLQGARFGSVDLDVNGGELVADLTGASLDSLSLEVNAGAGTVRLPGDHDYTASFTVNAGSLSVCTPPDLGVRIRDDGELSSTSFPGFVRSGDAWQTQNYATATNHANVTISVNVGSVEINPEGDCK